MAYISRIGNVIHKFRIIPNVQCIRLVSLGVSWGEATSIILGIHQRRGMGGERT